MPIWGPLFRVFESDARVRVRIDNLISYIETLQAGAGTREPGAMLFRTHCASCHGADARGAGPAAAAMRTPPPDLTTFARRNFPSERVRQIIDGRGIPARRPRHADMGQRLPPHRQRSFGRGREGADQGHPRLPRSDTGARVADRRKPCVSSWRRSSWS